MSTMDELVGQVQELTNATTDLLTATNISKQVLDQSVSAAEGSAQSAKVSEDIVTPAKNETITAKNEAVSARDQAVAIVHNDDGSLVSKAGAYPVGDSKGHLDVNWTPLLAAMYPNSGVIGSVDKGDNFHFDTVYSNMLWIKKKNRFNIFGRFVAISNLVEHSNGYRLSVLEAESTPERAIAFDDIFLDWDGNVTTYRSITPHRTTTGYDRDLIATEHGYSKVSTGLYKTGDTYALLLGRVARRNQGAYHPLWNPEGARWVATNNGGTYGWYKSESGAIPHTNKSTPFDIYPPQEAQDRAGAYSISGYIEAADGTRSGRPDSKFYDAIYADDFTPLYYSAKNVIDRQALLFDCFNRAVAGETFSGAEGTQQTGVLLIPDLSSLVFYSGIGSKLIPNGATANEKVLIKIESTGGATLTTGVELDTLYECTSVTRDSSNIFQKFQLSRDSDNLKEWVKEGNTNQLRVRVYHTRPSGLTLPSARPQILAVDIIGSLDAMPQEWLDEGIPGNWLAVGEEGESLIPDGTSKSFKLSRKVLDLYQILYTEDKGASWRTTENNGTWGSEIKSPANAFNSALPETNCVMVFYRTSANPFELTTSAGSSLAVSDAHFNAMASSSTGSRFVSNLIGKVSTGDASTKHFYSTPLTPLSLVPDWRGFWASPQFAPEHAPTILGQSEVSVKSFFRLVPSGKSLYLYSIYKEMRHNGTQWGDDNKFDIVDNQSTVTDLNGESCIVGQKKLETFYIFNGETY